MQSFPAPASARIPEFTFGSFLPFRHFHPAKNHLRDGLNPE